MPDRPLPTAARSPSHLLLVEDDEGLAILFQQELAGLDLKFHSVRTGQEALAWLTPRPDCLVLLDYSLPDMTAQALIESLNRLGFIPPFVVITGHGDERVAVSMMKLGARDYLVKDAFLLERLATVMARVLREIENQRRLATSENKFRAVFESSDDLILVLDEKGFLDCNQRALRRFGFDQKETLLGRTWADLSPATQPDGQDSFRTGQAWISVALQGKVCRFEWTHRHRDGSGFPAEILFSPFELEGRMVLQATVRDITERKRLEEQLRQAQKLEGVGRLAGGIAHDFNNILAAMLMNLDFLRSEPGMPPAGIERVSELEQGARRAADLTRQLLAFSRQQVLQVKPVELNSLVENFLKMVRRVLGEHIELIWWGGPGPMWIQADPGMIEQVAMNLCVNARDAMPKGGRLSLSTKFVEIKAQDAELNSEARPGYFVCLVVEDTGCGMNEATLKHIFEPFFTTKDVGKGTGLGLAMVYGILKQHGGWIEAESALEKGTVFRLFLPHAPQVIPRPTEKHDPVAVFRGNETILLVEDEVSVRFATALYLRRLGYLVHEAGTGAEALCHWTRHRQSIALLFADMVLPEGLTGLELAGKLRVDKPDLSVIISSGYNMDLLDSGGPAAAKVTYVPKPCEPVQLARIVRQNLDEQAAKNQVKK